MNTISPYIRVYVLGILAGWQQASFLDVSLKQKLKNAIKGANLSLCFIGYVPIGRTELFFKCSEVGALAATFDLITDGSKYRKDTKHKFFKLCELLLSAKAKKPLDELLLLKQEKCLKNNGLERGIFALEIIYNHLGIYEYWNDKVDIQKFGLFSQVADDILDFANDMKSDHLNFLKHDDANMYLDEFIEWDSGTDLKHGGYTLILGKIIQKTQSRARVIRKSFTKSQMSHKPTIAKTQNSEIITSRLAPDRYNTSTTSE